MAIVMMGGGLYLLTLLAAPAVMPILSKPIDAKALKKIDVSEDKIVIPKIGVNIPYGPGKSSLDTGAWWRYPERGNPEKGGNFIIAAHRFTLYSTIKKTVEKSPFYNIDKLSIGDKVVIDYNGKRYGYEIDKIFDVKPDQTDIESASKEAKLTLYTCNLGGAADGRVVLTAKPLGEITTN
jgi:sortase A